MKIYTKTGDKGQTSLFSGERVAKYDQRVNAYGTIDELNSSLGVLAAHLDGALKEYRTNIYQIQSILFNIGSWLATDPSSEHKSFLTEISLDDLNQMELAIDEMTKELPELTGFILPGGHPSSGFAHLCRSISRRAERKVLLLLEETQGYPLEIEAAIKKYLNRLSDYLFTLARYCNHKNQTEDILWKSGKK
jgi:cob(I)alamin adenosyltransferase